VCVCVCVCVCVQRRTRVTHALTSPPESSFTRIAHRTTQRVEQANAEAADRESQRKVSAKHQRARSADGLCGRDLCMPCTWASKRVLNLHGGAGRGLKLVTRAPHGAPHGRMEHAGTPHPPYARRTSPYAHAIGSVECARFASCARGGLCLQHTTRARGHQASTADTSTMVTIPMTSLRTRPAASRVGLKNVSGGYKTSFSEGKADRKEMSAPRS